MKSHQRVIRDTKASSDLTNQPYPNLDGFTVKKISKEESKTIILEYEWLGTMGRAYACYGLFKDEKLLGAINFGVPSSHESRNICGTDLAPRSICLERGACSHLAPANAASFFISKAVALASQDFGWEIFYAYSDPEAGEIGTVYQACNWIYIGQGVGRDPGRLREYYENVDGELISERTLRRRKLKKKDLIASGWQIRYKQPKHKYIFFQGSKSRKRELTRLCRYNFLSYPKRVTDHRTTLEPEQCLADQLQDLIYSQEKKKQQVA